jgi:hypothetical protein
MNPALVGTVGYIADLVFLGGALFGLGFAIFVGRVMLRIERQLAQLKEAYWRNERHGSEVERDLLRHYR